MRLIDADKLIEHNKTFVGNVIVTRSDIEKAPTVEAIPIEWIKKWANEQFYTFDREMYLKDMLEDWEAENGLD